MSRDWTICSIFVCLHSWYWVAYQLGHALELQVIQICLWLCAASLCDAEHGRHPDSTHVSSSSMTRHPDFTRVFSSWFHLCVFSFKDTTSWFLSNCDCSLSVIIINVFVVLFWIASCMLLCFCQVNLQLETTMWHLNCRMVTVSQGSKNLISKLRWCCLFKEIFVH